MNLEQEIKTIKRIKWAIIIYLPVYMVLTAIQYTSTNLYLYTKSENLQSNPRDYFIAILASNISKLALTSVLYYASLRFASHLKKIIEDASQEQGGLQD